MTRNKIKIGDVLREIERYRIMGEGVILSSDQADALLEMPRNLLNLMESMGFQMTNPAEPDYHFVRYYFKPFDV
jgi:hypothetical protein